VKVVSIHTNILVSLANLVLSGGEWCLQYIGYYEYLQEYVGATQTNRFVSLAKLVLNGGDWCL
jgi:hypothetical protein